MTKEIKYDNRIVAFIDILGFAEKIKKTETPKNNQINNLSKAFLRIRELLAIDEPDEDAAPTRQITQFSDSIVVSFDISEDKEFEYLLEELLHLQIELLKYDLLIRGGIYYGLLYHNDKLLFGPALVKAYRLESKAANSPRIILPKSINDLVSIKKIENLISNDEDDFFYLDYFDCWNQELIFPSDTAYVKHMKRLKSKILEGLKSEKPSIYSKYGWMKTKWNYTISKYRDENLELFALGKRKVLHEYFENEKLIKTVM
jgi:hypothetical protein